MLELLAKRHNEWISIVRGLGCPPSYVEDVVQETYLRLHKYSETIYDKLILKDNEVNTFYMFVSLRNGIRTMMNEENNYVNFEEFYYDQYEEPSIEMEAAFTSLMSKIRNESNSWGKYHSKLFNTYYLTDFSMRDIREQTGTSLTHIYSNLKKYKEIMIDKHRKDYINFKKENYDKL